MSDSAPAVPRSAKPRKAPVLRADTRELKLTGIRGRLPKVDVYFDGHRVWSTQLTPSNRPGGLRRVPWPDCIRPYLSGSSAVSVRSSATGQELVQAEVKFTSKGRVAITDAQGRWLAVNKWDRLGPSFDGDSSGVQERLLTAAVQVAKHVQDWGYPIYIVGGSLLGAMRTGELLPHDDDIDFAFYTEESDPQEIILISFELTRKLEEAGYRVVRHSHTHLEILYLTDEGHTDYYLDIFTGYHTADGDYNQPFALKGDLPKDQLLPIKPITVSGVELPGPAVPESWLAFAYGPKWRVPDPGFRWDTPLGTRRYFNNCFGVFNRQRVFWDKTWMKVDRRGPVTAADATESADVETFLSLLPAGAEVIDLGCGDGTFTEQIAAAGHPVLGIDYSYEAIRAARQARTGSSEPANPAYAFLNLNDRHSLLHFGLDLVEEGRTPYFLARNVVHQIPKLGRADLMLLIRQVLTADTFLMATIDVDEIPRIGTNPETWWLTVAEIRKEAWRWGLGVSEIASRVRPTTFGPRQNVTVLIQT